MTEPVARHRNPVTAHPVTSAAIAIILAATIFFVLYSPLYSTVTPKVGSWPFFYFYLLIFMPITSLALWIVTLLQKRLQTPDEPGTTDGQGSRAGVAS